MFLYGFKSACESLHLPCLVSACNLFSLYLLYKSIFLLLLLCRAVTSKAFRIRSRNFASTYIGYVDYKNVIKCNLKNAPLCLVFKDPVTFSHCKDNSFLDVATGNIPIADNILQICVFAFEIKGFCRLL